MAVIGASAAVAVAGCAGARITDGVFRSPKGYRVTLPLGDWEVVRGGGADLELRHRTEPAAMLVNASCDRPPSRATLEVLARHVLSGLRSRSIFSAGEISLNGKVARHSVLEGRFGENGERVRVELYVMRDARCVYDLLYVAPPAAFEAWRSGFGRLVETFVTE